MSYYSLKLQTYTRLRTTITRNPNPVNFKILALAVFESTGFSDKIIRDLLNKLVEADASIKHDSKTDTYYFKEEL